MSDRDHGSTELEGLVDRLWVGAVLSRGRGRRTGSASTTYLALPSPAKATLLLPLRPRRLAATVLTSHHAPHGLRQRVTQELMVRMAALGAARLVPRKVTVSRASPTSDSVESRLGALLGCEIGIGVHLGPPRANRKPIVQAVDRNGRTLAFAKVGINDLTRELVRDEQRALQALAAKQLTHLTVPGVLFAGQWLDNEVLVLSPVDTRSSQASQPRLLELAMVELATVDGREPGELVRSEHWVGMRQRIQALPDPQAAALLRHVVAFEKVWADVRVDIGAWHGDWTPWNMALRRERVVLWDWERFARGVPLGWDALHFQLQVTRRRGGATPAEAVSALVARSTEILAPFDVAASAAPATTGAYLIQMGARYLGDKQRAAGAPLGNLDAWLLPALSAMLSTARAERS